MSLPRQELEEIKARHWKVGGRGTVYPEQCVCGLMWPCDTAVALARIEELEKVVEAAREVWRLYGGPANYPLIAELGVALAALGGEDG